MPRNKSEKLPDYARNWSPDGIKLVREMAKDLAETKPIEFSDDVATGNFISPSRCRELYLERSVAASRDYNRRRYETYELIAHFFKEAHGQKSK